MRWLLALMGLAGCRDLLGIDDSKPKRSDAGMDSAIDALVDDGPDAMSACAPTYMHLPGQAHVYKRITAARTWVDQRDACAADGGYLVVPDDAAELQVIDDLVSNTTIWIGLADTMGNGTYVSVLGQSATFLPWDAGEPTVSDNKHCVLVLQNKQAYVNDVCGNPAPAVCECAP